MSLPRTISDKVTALAGAPAAVRELLVADIARHGAEQPAYARECAESLIEYLRTPPAVAQAGMDDPEKECEWAARSRAQREIAKALDRASGALRHAALSFQGCWFAPDSIWRRVNLVHPAVFAGAHFAGSARFHRACFGDQNIGANGTEPEWLEYLSPFTGARVEGSLSFSHCGFFQPTHLDHITVAAGYVSMEASQAFGALEIAHVRARDISLADLDFCGKLRVTDCVVDEGIVLDKLSGLGRIAVGNMYVPGSALVTRSKSSAIVFRSLICGAEAGVSQSRARVIEFDGVTAQGDVFFPDTRCESLHWRGLQAKGLSLDGLFVGDSSNDEYVADWVIQRVTTVDEPRGYLDPKSARPSGPIATRQGDVWL